MCQEPPLPDLEISSITKFINAKEVPRSSMKIPGGKNCNVLEKKRIYLEGKLQKDH